MEWQPGGLTWAMDNWLYSTYNPFRLRVAPEWQDPARGRPSRTAASGGRAQDNYGKMWWVDGGGEIGPVNFQAPIVYGAFNVPDNFEPDFQVPLAGAGRHRRHAGRDAPRAHAGRHAEPLHGGVAASKSSAAIVSPKTWSAISSSANRSARIVRRAKVVETDGLTQLRNAYPKSEFIRSTDPLFRPVDITNAPDGTLYLMDMYTRDHPGRAVRRPGDSICGAKSSSTRSTSSATGAASGASRTRGRRPIGPQPRMYRDTPAQLVTHLEHPNGWWRDTAQKLLVLRQDKSVVPALGPWRARSSNQLARCTRCGRSKAWTRSTPRSSASR